MVQEAALTALASAADSSKVYKQLLFKLSGWPLTFFLTICTLSIQEHFQKYYDAVMPYLKAILMNATDKSNRMLRAKSMECISLVGMAVGKQKFKDDAKQVISVIVSYSIVHNSFLLQKHLKLNMLYFPFRIEITRSN
jgi:importin-5